MARPGANRPWMVCLPKSSLSACHPWEGVGIRDSNVDTSAAVVLRGNAVDTAVAFRWYGLAQVRKLPGRLRQRYYDEGILVHQEISGLDRRLERGPWSWVTVRR